jgi:hypothetical protein
MGDLEERLLLSSLKKTFFMVPVYRWRWHEVDT